MDLENKTESEIADDFVALKTFKIHMRRYTEVFAELVPIKEKLSVGLQRKRYLETLSNHKTTSIYVTFEAWETLRTETATSIWRPSRNTRLRQMRGRKEEGQETAL